MILVKVLPPASCTATLTLKVAFLRMFVDGCTEKASRLATPLVGVGGAAVLVGAFVGVIVSVAVNVGVGVFVTVGVFDAVRVGAGVRVFVGVKVFVRVAVAVAVGVSVPTSGMRVLFQSLSRARSIGFGVVGAPPWFDCVCWLVVRLTLPLALR